MSIKIFKRPFQICHVQLVLRDSCCRQGFVRAPFSSTKDATREATGTIRNAVRHAVRLSVPPCNFVAL
jgi:hypothetical protein